VNRWHVWLGSWGEAPTARSAACDGLPSQPRRARGAVFAHAAPVLEEGQCCSIAGPRGLAAECGGFLRFTCRSPLTCADCVRRSRAVTAFVAVKGLLMRFGFTPIRGSNPRASVPGTSGQQVGRTARASGARAGRTPPCGVRASAAAGSACSSRWSPGWRARIKPLEGLSADDPLAYSGLLADRSSNHPQPRDPGLRSCR
jgi:hypothetical protein